MTKQQQHITIIVGTNRKNSKAHRFGRFMADVCASFPSSRVSLIDLQDIPIEWFTTKMYNEDHQHPSLKTIQDEHILPAQKFIFIIPEYNGSYPGILKLFLDAISVRAYRENFFHKKAFLIGIATGRAGNLRGIDHLMGILQHMGTIIFPTYTPLSSIGNLVDADGNLIHEETIALLNKQIAEFIEF